MLAVGTRPLSEGVNIGAAHIDSPGWISPNPLAEDAELAFSRPLLRRYPQVPVGDYPPGAPRRGGLKDGLPWPCLSAARRRPQFTIDDLLPHPGRGAVREALGEAIPAKA